MEQGKNVLIGIVVVAGLLGLFGTFGMGGYGMMGFGMGYGFIFMLLILGALIWLGAALIGAAHVQKGEDDSLTILKRRYASGEITKKKFDEMKKEIER